MAGQRGEASKKETNKIPTDLYRFFVVVVACAVHAELAENSVFCEKFIDIQLLDPLYAECHGIVRAIVVRIALSLSIP